MENYYIQTQPPYGEGQGCPTEVMRFLHNHEVTDSIRSRNNIPKDLLCQSTDSAFCFGYYDDGAHIVGKKAEKDGHIAIFGGSGTGKTTSIALPTIFTWQDSKFVIDLKGDMIGWGIAIGAKFLFLQEGYRNDYYYDPFDFLRKGGRNNVNTNALEIASILIPLSSDSRENYWLEAAQGVLASAIAYYFKLGLDFIGTMLMVKTKKMVDLIKTIKMNDSEAALCLSGDIVSNPHNAAIISTELHNHISIFVNDPVIREAFSSSKNLPKKLIQWTDLEQGDIFIRLDQSRMTEWRQVVQLMLVQLIRTLERRPEKYSLEGAGIKPTLLLLDEFPLYGRLDIFESAMRVLRSKNVTFAIFCQSIADLNKLYGIEGRKTLLENCPYQAVLGSNDVDTQKYFSEKSGTVLATHRGVSANYDPNWQPLGRTSTANEVIEPAIFPEEFAVLADIVLFHPGVFLFSKIGKAEPVCDELPIKAYKKRGVNMENSTENEIFKVEEKAKWLEKRRKVELKKEAEAKKKRIQHRKFLIGEIFCEFFPDILDFHSDVNEDEDVFINSLKSVLLMLSLDKSMVVELQEKAKETAQIFLEENSGEADEECFTEDELNEDEFA